MMHFDVFNGDADGICALIQLRLNSPKSAQLVTGIKREIDLLKKVSAQSGDEITVLDISMKTNRDYLLTQLKQGAKVFYVDHHQTGEIPQHPNLTALIDTHSDTCTSLIVNTCLQNRFALWAIVGAFGDNLDISAIALANQFSISTAQLEQLKILGVCVNYNSYGDRLESLTFAPDWLYQKMVAYSSPFLFMENEKEIYQQLLDSYHGDIAAARQLSPYIVQENAALYLLPNTAWAKRVIGTFSNELAQQNPHRAHALLLEKENGNFQISVRSALLNKNVAADELCSQFPTGGGRKIAAGINELDKAAFDEFVQTYLRHYNATLSTK